VSPTRTDPHPILNVSSYRFVPLDDLPALRDRLHADAQARDLKGTVLLAEEGINLFLAGPADAVNGWLDALRADARFAGLQAKESWSAETPFKRLKVKVKREIIRMDRPTIRPAEGRAPALAPEVLARWLTQGHDDDGRPVRMLDTRNAFEVDEGAFDDAIDWRITKFTEFPPALEAHRAELQDVTVVSYCTGGIRCEKAAILMQDLGLKNSWQLEGGILKYLELTSHNGVAPGWHGRCFVFDERVGLDADLQAPTAAVQPA
jgi:UPF0176 protein